MLVVWTLLLTMIARFNLLLLALSLIVLMLLFQADPIVLRMVAAFLLRCKHWS